MDGDQAGRAFADEKSQVSTSILFNRFAQAVRGDSAAGTVEERLGEVASRNGVLLFAGGDEMLALFPAEDAFDAVVALRHRFVAERTKVLQDLPESKETMTAELTISGAVLFSHVRTPLAWAIRGVDELLNRVAKDDVRRNALAMAVLDGDGLRPEWAAKWDSPQIAAFGGLLRLAMHQHAFLWSNQFYHDLGKTLAAFTIPIKPSYAGRLDTVHEKDAKENIGNSIDRDLILALIMRALGVELRNGDDPQPIAECLFEILSLVGPQEKHSNVVIPHRGAVYLAALDILRVLGAGWCKDNDPAVAASLKPAVTPNGN